MTARHHAAQARGAPGGTRSRKSSPSRLPGRRRNPSRGRCGSRGYAEDRRATPPESRACPTSSPGSARSEPGRRCWRAAAGCTSAPSAFDGSRGGPQPFCFLWLAVQERKRSAGQQDHQSNDGEPHGYGADHVEKSVQEDLLISKAGNEGLEELPPDRDNEHHPQRDVPEPKDDAGASVDEGPAIDRLRIQALGIAREDEVHNPKDEGCQCPHAGYGPTQPKGSYRTVSENQQDDDRRQHDRKDGNAGLWHLRRQTGHAPLLPRLQTSFVDQP